MKVVIIISINFYYLAWGIFGSINTVVTESYMRCFICKVIMYDVVSDLPLNLL